MLSSISVSKTLRKRSPVRSLENSVTVNSFLISGPEETLMSLSIWLLNNFNIPTKMQRKTKLIDEGIFIRSEADSNLFVCSFEIAALPYYEDLLDQVNSHLVGLQ